MRNGFIFISNNVYSTLFACSSDEQEKGLMHVEWPPPIMSFVYAAPKVNKFWMKNTQCPLDIIFCCEGKVTQICKGEPNSTRVIGNDTYSDLIIELPYGTAKSSDLKINNSAGIISPTKDDLKNYLK